MAETSIVYDYEQNEVRMFTDRAGVANQIGKRLKGNCTIVQNRSGDRITSWSIAIDMKYCRNAYAIAKVIGNDAESPSENALQDASEEFPVRLDVYEAS